MPRTPPSREPITEEWQLAEADRHIAESEEQLARQRKIVGRLTAMGSDTTEAERLLRNIEDVLYAAHANRRMIARKLEDG